MISPQPAQHISGCRGLEPFAGHTCAGHNVCSGLCKDLVCWVAGWCPTALARQGTGLLAGTLQRLRPGTPRIGDWAPVKAHPAPHPGLEGWVGWQAGSGDVRKHREQLSRARQVYRINKAGWLSRAPTGPSITPPNSSAGRHSFPPGRERRIQATGGRGRITAIIMGTWRRERLLKAERVEWVPVCLTGCSV